MIEQKKLDFLECHVYMKKYLIYILSLIFVQANSQQDYFDKIESFYGLHKDSTYYYLEKAYKTSEKKEDKVAMMKALCYTNEVSKFYNDIPYYQASLKKQDVLMSNISGVLDSLPEGTYYKHYYWHNKGSYYYIIQDYDLARKYFFIVLNSIQKLPDSIVLQDYSDFQVIANNYVATTYRNELKYEIAEEFYNENLRLQHKYKQSIEALIDTKNLIASLKSAQGDLMGSNEISKKSIDYYLKDAGEIDINSFLSTSALLINNYLKRKEIDSAALYLNKAAPFLKKQGRFTADFLFLKGRTHHIQGALDKALESYSNGLGFLANIPEAGDQMVEFYNETANVYLERGNVFESIQVLNKSLDLFNRKNDTQNPIAHTANNQMNILSTLKLKSSALLKSGRSRDLEETINTVFLGLENINAFKKKFYNEGDKQILTENALPIIENGIEASYRLYRNSINAYIDTAFVFFEQSKSPILLDVLYRTNATKFAGVPDSLLEKEKILKRTIADLEKEIYIDQLDRKAELFKVKRQHETLLQYLEGNHPSYFQLKYRSTVAGLSNTINGLKEGEGILSYFYGEKAVYVISASPRLKGFHKIPIYERDSALLQNFHKLISDVKGDLDSLNSTSFKVYQKYVAPFLKNLNANRLLVIPDGPLQSVPFDALNTEPNGVSYLIEGVAVSYSNSVSLLTHLKKKPKEKPSILAFAPIFKTQKGKELFNPLPNAAKELEKLGTFFKGKTIVGKKATLSRFYEVLNNYSVIHLATHAITNDNVPEYSFLAFSPFEDEHLMYVNDIYAHDFDADLVTLSACETGLGQLKKGEGAISLARAFFYSGARSLVNTLWNITDKSSSDIMGLFYAGLYEGKAKDKALRDAKITFIKKNKDTRLTHPYYWSSFTIQGNVMPLVLKNYSFWYLLGGSFILCLVLVLRKSLIQIFK